MRLPKLDESMLHLQSDSNAGATTSLEYVKRRQVSKRVHSVSWRPSMVMTLDRSYELSGFDLEGLIKHHVEKIFLASPRVHARGVREEAGVAVSCVHCQS